MPSRHTRVVPEVPDTKKIQKIWEKISLFPNNVSFWLNTLFPKIFNSFDTLFVVRTFELLKMAPNRRLHLFTVGKSFTPSHFFKFEKRKLNEASKFGEQGAGGINSNLKLTDSGQSDNECVNWCTVLMKQHFLFRLMRLFSLYFDHSNSAISSHNTRRWLFSFFKDKNNENYFTRITNAMTLTADGRAFACLELILPFQFIVLAIPSSQVWGNGPMFHLWLRMNAKYGFVALKHCQTLDWNILTTLFFVPLWANYHPTFCCKHRTGLPRVASSSAIILDLANENIISNNEDQTRIKTYQYVW